MQCSPRTPDSFSLTAAPLCFYEAAREPLVPVNDEQLIEAAPNNLRRTAITRALDSGLTYRQVQMMSKHRDPKTVMRYDHGRENLEQNAVNFLAYDEET